jgi:hypothetical protein
VHTASGKGLDALVKRLLDMFLPFEARRPGESDVDLRGRMLDAYARKHSRHTSDPAFEPLAFDEATDWTKRPRHDAARAEPDVLLAERVQAIEAWIQKLESASPGTAFFAALLDSVKKAESTKRQQAAYDDARPRETSEPLERMRHENGSWETDEELAQRTQSAQRVVAAIVAADLGEHGPAPEPSRVESLRAFTPREHAFRCVHLARSEPTLPAESVVYQASLSDRAVLASEPRCAHPTTKVRGVVGQPALATVCTSCNHVIAESPKGPWIEGRTEGDLNVAPWMESFAHVLGRAIRDNQPFTPELLAPNDGPTFLADMERSPFLADVYGTLKREWDLRMLKNRDRDSRDEAGQRVPDLAWWRAEVEKLRSRVRVLEADVGAAQAEQDNRVREVTSELMRVREDRGSLLQRARLAEEKIQRIEDALSDRSER